MNGQQLVKYQGKTYFLLQKKGEYMVICNGDYDKFGEAPITVRKDEVVLI